MLSAAVRLIRLGGAVPSVDGDLARLGPSPVAAATRTSYGGPPMTPRRWRGPPECRPGCPGPMVGAMVRVRRYWPLAPLGRARLIASRRVARFSTSCWVFEARLAERDVDDAALVDLELDAAGLDLFDRPLEIEGDRARLGVRHQASAAEDAAELADHAHDVRARPGRRRTRVQPASIFLTRSSAPTSSAPARSASWAFSP